MPALRHPALEPPGRGTAPSTRLPGGRPTTRLARDVVVVLALKAAALTLLWLAFFRGPAAPDMAMDPGQVADRVLAPKAPDADP